MGTRPLPWLAPPRNLLLALAALTIGSAAALGWLGWQILQQEEIVEAQRAHERLEHDADRAVQDLERQLSDIDTLLTEWTDAASAAEDAPAAGLGVIFTTSGFRTIPPASLLFHPVLPARAEPSDDLFIDGEKAEFQRRDYVSAAASYRQLARSRDAATRAAALMRLGRVMASARRHEESLTTFEHLAALGDVPLIGLPAELVGRHARLPLLRTVGRVDAARTEAAALVQDLQRARWTLARGQYEHYVESAAAVAGEPPRTTEALATAHAVADLWDHWTAQRVTRGRRVQRVGSKSVLVAWRGTQDRLGAWVGEPAALVARLNLDPDRVVTLSDAEGFIAGDATRPQQRQTVRPAAETRLPWTLHVSATASPNASGFSRRLLVAALTLLVLFLASGSYFIGRAVRHEMALARLQSDFVSAVSHEFRTPLSAMRQFSELLASGRVPSEAKRQHYYESLAGESRRLQRLVENLLNFGRLEAGAMPYRLEPLDARAVVEEVVDAYRSQLSRPDCRIEIAGSADAPALMGNRDALGLALHNLLDNAVKYAGVDRPVRIDWRRQKDRVALSVSDQGPGIAPDEQGRIFQKFVRGAAAGRGNVRGTGVGLAMVRLVAEGHGGEVVLESRPGEGSTFTILVPAAEAS